MIDGTLIGESIYHRLGEALAPHGLCVRGGVHFDDAGPTIGGRVMKSVVLIGYVGASHWTHFERHKARHHSNDPLDNWSKQVIEPIAGEFSGFAIYPFEKPWWPFQTWISRSEGLKASPLGILIHPEYGLWHGYRGALVFDLAINLPPLTESAHPCDSCSARPCINNCPAAALADGQFEVDACRRYLAGETGDDGCLAKGCASRNACPVGSQYRYHDAQLRFHMDALTLPSSD